MSPTSAKTLVLVTGGLMLAIVGIRHDAIADPFRAAWGAGVITLFLSLLADIAPEVAGPAAILVLLAVYWKHKGVLGSVLPSSNAGATAAKPFGSNLFAGGAAA